MYKFTYYYNVKYLNGRSERTRTFDPLVPNQVRCQTALHSDKRGIVEEAFNKADLNRDI